MTGEELRRIMWGRASFSTPVRVSPRVDQPQVSAVTAGFGGALTTALDMMAFAHDIDLSTATEGIPTNVDVKHAKPKIPTDGQTNAMSIKQEKPATKPLEEHPAATKIVPQNDRNDLNKKPIEPVNIQEMNRKNSSHTTIEEIQDPLLELVIASENMPDQESLMKIAQRVLASVDLPADPIINLQIVEQFTMIKMPMEEPVAPVKKQYFVESSDNDFGGDNLLGTEARLRRIRSANNRFITTRRHSRHGDGNLSSSSSTSADGNARYPSFSNDPEEKLTNRQIEGREGVESIMPQIKQNGTCNSSKSKPHKRRPKTARNRVSPKEMEEPSQRRRESIERDKTVSRPTSSTDPLEPWSTRDIKDMNTILAWEENLPDSP